MEPSTAIALSSLVLDFIETITPTLKDVFKKSKNELNHFLGDNLHNYLLRQAKAYGTIKTILHRSLPKDFQAIYHPAFLRQDESYDDASLEIQLLHIPTESPRQLFEAATRLTIIGEAGSGKSMLIRYFFLKSLKEAHYIPVVIEFRNHDTATFDLVEATVQQLCEGRAVPSADIARRLIFSGRMLFLLDGFDEIPAAHIKQVVLNLRHATIHHGDNVFVLTSRPQSEAQALQGFSNYRIKGLSDRDIPAFIRRQGLPTPLPEQMIASIEDSDSQFIQDFLQNPLLLSLYMLTYESMQDIPKQRHVFYRRVWDVLCKEHDSFSKTGFRREFKSEIAQEEVEKVLQRFAYTSLRKNRLVFDRDFIGDCFKEIRKNPSQIQFTDQNLIDDLTTAYGVWLEDAGTYTFAHKSIQEYFAACRLRSIGSPAKKEQAYQSHWKWLKSDPMGRENSINFLSLCLEMDEYAFLKWFSLPALKEWQSSKNSCRSLGHQIALFFPRAVVLPTYPVKEQLEDDYMEEYEADPSFRQVELLTYTIHTFIITRPETVFLSFDWPQYDEVLQALSGEIIQDFNPNDELGSDSSGIFIDFARHPDDHPAIKYFWSQLSPHIAIFHNMVDNEVARIETRLAILENDHDPLLFED